MCRELPLERLAGLAVTRHGYGRPTRHIPVIEAGHPIPDKAGIDGDQAYARARRRGGRRRSCAGALSGGASANWIAPVTGLTLEEKQAVTRALLKRRRDRRDQHGAQAPLAHQGRPARRARPSGASRDARDLRRARRRSGGHRLRPDHARPDDARRRARDRRAAIVWNFPTPLRAPRRSRNETPKPGDAAFADPDYHRGAARRRVTGRGGTGQRRRAMSASSLGGGSRAKRARSPPSTPGWRASSWSGPPRRHSVRWRTHRDAARQGPGRPNQEYALALALNLDGAPGIAALAADTDGTDGGRGRSGRPRGRLHRRDDAGAGAYAASIPPRFSPTTILRGFSMGSAICSGLARPSPTSRISVPSLLTGHEALTGIPNRK